MPKIVPPARCGLAVFAALAGLAIINAPIQTALGDKPSTPVTVVNPATSPALTSNVDDPGRIAYQTAQEPECTLNPCDFSFPDVPAGHRLVIQHVSGELFLALTPSAIFVRLAGTGFLNRSVFFAPFVGRNSLFDQSVLFYYDAGQVPGVEISLAGTNFAGGQIVTLTGYLLDCTAVPCSATAP